MVLAWGPHEPKRPHIPVAAAQVPRCFVFIFSFSFPIQVPCQPPAPRSPGLIAHPSVRERVVHEDSVSTHRGRRGGIFSFLPWPGRKLR